jgi:aminoglycoside 3-N-acetyltransferase
MDPTTTVVNIANELKKLDIGEGDILLVHSSLSSLGYVPGGAETVIRGLLQALGPHGTLLMPALSWQQQPPDIHNSRLTPSNVGAIPETFRKREGTLRSLHPTHSMCGVGQEVKGLFHDHLLDATPCGAHSPFNRGIDMGMKILMLGCGLRPLTIMHALEEYIIPPYLFGEDRIYTITDWEGCTFQKTYRIHGFKGWQQRYDRVALLPGANDFLSMGKVLKAEGWLLDSQSLKTAVIAKMREDPLFFVDKTG